MSNEIAIRVSNLGKCYHIYDAPSDRLKQFVLPRLKRLAGQSSRDYFRPFWALRNLSFEVKRGETVGIIGRNGSGKSTLLQILAGTLTPTNGEVNINGRVAALLELGSGFNPEFTGRENVYLNGQILGLSPEEIDARYEQIVEFSEIGEFIDQPVKTYSSGMFVRLAFAVQAHIDASIVIIDEALAVGDIFFRQKCYARLEQLKQSGAAILLVSHSMPDIEQYCERAILLDRGEPRFMGSSFEAAKHYYVLNQAKPDSKTSVREAPRREGSDASRPTDQEMNFPPDEFFADLSNAPQVGTGRARCTRVALCNSALEPCNSFRQGDTAIFFYEFELKETIGVPVCGIVLFNDRGIIVHGKNAWQYEGEAPLHTGRGSKILCRQEFSLNLALGEYSFEIGLASVSEENWVGRAWISHEDWEARYCTECVATHAGHFSIRLAHNGHVDVLTHHGIADLPGTLSVGAINSCA